jgi:hypothetical protein
MILMVVLTACLPYPVGRREGAVAEGGETK